MKRLALVRRDLGSISPLRKVLLTIAGVLLSLVAPAAIIALLGFNPLAAYRDLALGSVGGSFQLGSTLIKFSPLLTAGIGVAIAFRAGLWNIGNLGQFLVGGAGAVLTALVLGSYPGAWLVALLAGSLAGALWALLPGLLRVFWSINEVITTLMMNYIGVLLIDYLVTGPLKDPITGLPQTQQIPAAAQLPILGSAQSQVHAGVVIGVVLAIAFHFVLFRTALGYDLRAVGKNPRAAEYSGIDVRRTLLNAMLISGAFSGLAGAGEVLGLHYRLLDGIAGGYEYTPIVVALLGELSPLGILIPAFVFAGLLVGGQTMQIDTGLPASFVGAIEALIVLFVIGMQFFDTYKLVWHETTRQDAGGSPPVSQAEKSPPEVNIPNPEPAHADPPGVTSSPQRNVRREEAG
jgi:ABC-type uncharacterized transport system permease subunit